ncbi:lincomycin-condensing lmbA [Fusarium albosuccineum]|uniref:Lincomycin-condensing lmbA n=1 Tax=Fusarium albosuccineum TaxID=1237068 RepID=A0A8H4LJW1_9HYPO|nr:lincomycin-condensing lmbA [Fusarium albosuccineum]
MTTQEPTVTEATTERHQPSLSNVQRALSISAFDIPHNGEPILQKCAGMTEELILRNTLPPLEASSTRVLVLGAYFSPDNREEWASIRHWFTQFKNRRLRPSSDVWALRNLWSGRGSCDSSRTFWVCDYAGEVKEKIQEWKANMKSTPFLRAEYLQYGRQESLGAYVWRCASSVNADYLEDGRVQITCRFPLIPGRSDARRHRYSMFPDPNLAIPSRLKHNFLRLFLSQESATRLHSPTPEAAVMAVTLDILRASAECWSVFLSDLIQKIERISRQQMWLHSQQSLVIREIPVAVSHLELALRHTYACFLAEVKQAHDADMEKLGSLERENDAKLEMVQIQVRHWLSLVEKSMDITAAHREEVQAQSIIRLSLLAAIFLPIGHASSLLSMNVRAVDLGLLWFDYIGLAIVVMFFVALLHLCLWIWDRGRRRARPDRDATDEEKTAYEKPTGAYGPEPYSDDAADQFVEIIRTHEGSQEELQCRLKQVVSANGWTESLAESVLRKIENIVKEGAKMAKPMADAIKKATDTALEFAKEHPVYAGLIAAGTLIAIAILGIFDLVWVLRALGFAQRGPRLGTFAARWMSRIGNVPKGSIYSYFQRLGMKIHLLPE